MSIIEVDLAYLQNYFPKEPNIPIEYELHGPLSPMLGEDGKPTIEPFIKIINQRGFPFIIWTENEDGNPISLIWDGENTETYYEDGHSYGKAPIKAHFITCKWYAPSEQDMNEDPAIFLHDDYPFDKTFPQIKQCTNPDPNMGIACGFSNHQPLCSSYESEIVKTPVHFKDKNSNNSIKTREARVNDGIKIVQIVQSIDDETSVVTYKASEMPIEALTHEALECASNNFQEFEKIEVKSDKNSFIKGLIGS